MDTKKKLLCLFALATVMALADGKAALRRKPKIYNALITTDENLVQSRAYPVIQPTIHESGIAHYPTGPFSSYGFYNPHLVRFGQPIAPNLQPKEQLPYPLPPAPFPPQAMGQPLVPQPQAIPGYDVPQATAAAPTAQQTPETQTPPTAPALEESSPPTRQPPTMLMPAPAPLDPNQQVKMPLEKLPIPLNQYGLPPSLIPLPQQYPQQYPQPVAVGPSGQPLFLPPHGFQRFSPAFQGSYPAFRQPYLPHYGFLPTGPQYPLSNAIPIDKTYPLPAPPAPAVEAAPQPPQVPLLPAPQTTEAPPVTPALPPEPSAEPEPSFDNIKNGSKSPDSNVPDVPPPPIPSGAKPMES